MTREDEVKEVLAIKNKEIEFQRKNNGIATYYYHKFAPLFKTKAEENEFIQLFEGLLDSSIFNGYIIGLQFLRHEDTVLQEEFFKQPKGIRKELICNMVLEAMGKDYYEYILTDVSKEFTQWLIIKYENVLPLVRATIVDITLSGSIEAFEDTLKDKFLSDDMIETNSYLHPLHDFYFPVYDRYYTNFIKTPSTELWNLFQLGNVGIHEKKIGELTIIKNTSAEEYIVSLQLKNTLIESEIFQIVKNTYNKLHENMEVMNGAIKFQYSLVDNFYLL